MVSTTYLVLRPKQSARFQQLMGPILQQLPSQPGLLAWQFKNSRKCGTARTFAVWENEEQMFEFVRSPAHLDAIRNQLVVATEASTTVAFEAQPDELSWERALREFDAEAGSR